MVDKNATAFDQPVWYHDFANLGQPTAQRGRIFKLNQQAKEKPICELLNKAINIAFTKCPAKPKKRGEPKPVKGIELFCADGFYANYAVGACRNDEHMHLKIGCVDLNDDELQRGKTVTAKLGHTAQIRYRAGNVLKVRDKYDLVICTGGLYHVEDPMALLRQLKKMTRGALVLQTVYSLESTEPDYFIQPPPTNPAGSRFSLAWLRVALDEVGLEILEEDANMLEGNKHPCERGSAYLLCKA